MAPKGQRLLVLATREDWTPILTSLEEVFALKYVRSGIFVEPRSIEYQSFRDIPKFGEALEGDATREQKYLIMKRNAPVFFRTINLTQGGICYGLDHGNNPDSVVFSAGGILHEPKAVIQGELSKLSTLPSAEEIYRAVSRFAKKHLGAIKAYRVGPEALSLRKDGFRLTASVGAPVEYDLSL